MADQDKKKVTKDLTARELELTALVFQCFDNGAPKVSLLSHLHPPSWLLPHHDPSPPRSILCIQPRYPGLTG